MTYAFTPLAAAAAAAAHNLPLISRTPTQRLVHAREDHAKLILIAADFRARIARGERDLRARHTWALGHARALRDRFPSRLSTPAV